jgi:hypothetical protein
MRKLLIVLVVAASTLPGSPSSKEPQQLNLCTLVTDWQQFSGKTIRVKALFQEGAEQSSLSDPTCRNGEHLVFVSPTAHVEGKKGRLRRILRKDRQAEVVLEGVFRGPELAPIDPKLPESMKEKLKGSRLRYGHLGSFDMMIEVTKIVEAETKGKK